LKKIVRAKLIELVSEGENYETFYDMKEKYLTGKKADPTTKIEDYVVASGQLTQFGANSVSDIHSLGSVVNP
jgi:hypothetical protein